MPLFVPHSVAKSTKKPTSPAPKRRLVVLPDPNPRRDIPFTEFELTPAMQQKIIAQALLKEKADAAYEAYSVLWHEYKAVWDELDVDLQLVAALAKGRL